MKSVRPDRRGHWPRGKRRSTLSYLEHERVLKRLERALESHGSAKAVARAIRCSDRTVRRLLAGEDWPLSSTAEKILRRL